MFKGKLRNKIFLMMALVSIVPVVVAGFLSVWSITLSHKIDVANLEGVLIEQKRNEIKNFMDNVVGNLQLRVAYEQVSDIDPQAKKILLTQMLSGIPELEDIAFIGLDGKETLRYNKAYPDGVPENDLRDQSGLEKFVLTKDGKDYIGPLYHTLGGPMVTIASPAKNKNGVVISILSGEVRLNRIKDIVSGARLGREGYLTLVDQGGFIVASGADRLIPRVSIKNLALVLGVLSGKDFLGPDQQTIYKSVFGGEEVVAAAKFLPEYGWGLISEWPIKEADASLNELLYNNLLVLAVVVVAVILASVLLATIIVRPIRALEVGTERVAEGKFEEVIAIKTGDELEELGESFNKMMAGLKRLEELKDEFVFIAAHELRTPVAAMKGYLSLVLDGTTGAINEKTKDFVQKVLHANERLVQLVNDLLEVSRSEAGRLVIKVAPIDLATPIHEVLSELEKMAEEKKVELVHEAPPGLPKVLADPDRLKEVMINLVGNSIKYMGGSGTVTISYEPTTNTLITHIKDTGLGMSKEAQAKLFEKFYRVSTEKTKNITGTGLGLFIVKEIVEKMGGKIWAESEGEGRGSTFSFSLPIAA